jgi:exonuclease SbcC
VLAQQVLDSIGEVDFDQKSYLDLKSKITSLRPLAERCKVLRGEGSRLPDLEARRTDRESIAKAKDGEMQRAKKDLDAVGYREGDLKAAQDGYDAAFRAREAAYSEVSRKASALDLVRERLKDRNRDLADIIEKEKSIAERAKKVEQLATLEKVMIDFRQNVMDRVVPTLSEVSSQFFCEMTDSKYGGIELDENYEMQVYDGKDKYPLSRFSGGEADLANLCLRLAISRVLADRSGNDINFLILDEIFGSQDQVRKRNIMATLNRLEKQFQQIILITHIDDTKDFMNNVITIRELEDGTSTVEQ